MKRKQISTTLGPRIINSSIWIFRPSNLRIISSELAKKADPSFTPWSMTGLWSSARASGVTSGPGVTLWVFKGLNHYTLLHRVASRPVIIISYGAHFYFLLAHAEKENGSCFTLTRSHSIYFLTLHIWIRNICVLNDCVFSTWASGYVQHFQNMTGILNIMYMNGSNNRFIGLMEQWGMPLQNLKL